MDSVVDIFIDLARTPSPSGREEEVVKKVEKYAGKMGAEVKRDSFGNVFVSFEEDLFEENPQNVIFCAHLDTVEPAFEGKIVVENGYLKSEGRTILGVDDKAGVASAIYGTWRFVEEIRKTFKEKNKRSRVRPYLLFTLQEEIGSLGAKNLDYSFLPERAFVYVLDGEGKVGTITLSAPYHYRWEITFHGKEAHAGVEPEKGINAIVMLSEWISSLRWGLLEKGFTASVGKVEGGRAMNVVPAKAKASGEFRNINEKQLDELWNRYLNLAEKISKKYGGSYEARRDLTFKGFSVRKEDPQVMLVIRALDRMNLKPVFVDSMGGSDANFLVERFPVLVLGIGGENFHSPEEKISIKELENCAKMVYEVLEASLEVL